MSYGNPHQQPQYPGYQQRPQKSGSGGSVLKILLIVFGIIGGIGLLVIIACAGGLYMLGRGVNEAKKTAEAEMERAALEAWERFTRIDSSVPSPTDITQAIAYLNREEVQYHRAAAEWFDRQPLNPSDQPRAKAALTIALKSGDRQCRRAALQALRRWGDESLSGDVAAGLRPGDELNRIRFELLGKWKRPVGSDKIVEMLGSTADAEKAFAALMQIGPPAAPYVASVINESGSKGDYAKRLIESWGIDPQQAMMDLFVEQLKSDNPFEREEAAGKLSSMDFDDAIQQTIVDGVREASQMRGGCDEDLMRVLLAWGDESCLPMVHQHIRENDTGAPIAFQVVGKIKSEESLSVIGESLPSFFNIGDQAANALSSYGDVGIPTALEYVNHPEERARDRARRVINEVGVDGERLLDQCIEDLESGEEGRVTAVFSYLREIEVSDEDRRDELASAMGRGFDDVNVFKKEEAAKQFLDFCGPNQYDYIVQLTEHRDDDVWRPAFRKLVTECPPEDVKVVAAGLLTDFFKKKEAYTELERLGRQIEPLVILMLEHSDAEMVIAMAGWLAANGSEAAQRPIERLIDRAEKNTARNVKEAAEFARREIIARIRRAEAAGADDSDDGSADDDGSQER